MNNLVLIGGAAAAYFWWKSKNAVTPVSAAVQSPLNVNIDMTGLREKLSQTSDSVAVNTANTQPVPFSREAVAAQTPTFPAPAMAPFTPAVGTFGTTTARDQTIWNIEASAPAVAFDNTRIDNISGYTVGFNPGVMRLGLA